MFEFAFDHVRLSAQRLARGWTAARLQVVGKGALAHSGGAVKHYLGYVRANRKRLLGG